MKVFSHSLSCSICGLNLWGEWDREKRYAIYNHAPIGCENDNKKFLPPLLEVEEVLGAENGTKSDQCYPASNQRTEEIQ